MLGIKTQVVTLADYRDIDLRPYAAPFSMEEEELQKELMKYCIRYGTMEKAETVAEGDIVSLRLQGSSPRFMKEAVQVRVGKGLLNRELEQKLLGLPLGQTADLSVDGEAVQVTVLEIRRRIPAPLEDAAVASWGLEGIADVEALRRHIVNSARNQYAEDMGESLALFLSDEVCRLSTFILDEEELEIARKEGHDMALDMLRSGGIDPDTATDEEIQNVTGGRTREEHFAFVEGISMDGVKSTAVGALLMEQEHVPMPTEEAYEEAVTLCAEGMGLSMEEARKVVTLPRFYRQQAGNYFFEKLIAYCKQYLTKED